MQATIATKCMVAGLFAVVICMLGFAQLSWGNQLDPDERAMLDARRRLLDAVEREGAGAVPVLTEALRDDRMPVYRTAAHLLAHLGKPALSGIAKALEHPDYRVRLVAIDALGDTGNITDYWAAILMDEHPAVRRVVKLVLLDKYPLPEGKAFDRIVEQLMRKYRTAPASTRRYVVDLFASFDPLPPQARRVLTNATGDEDTGVRESAYEAILTHIDRDWPQAADLIAAAKADESQIIRRMGEQIEWKLLQVAEVRLPREGWRFRTDPEDVGREREWYAPDFDDSGWRKDVPIESSWQDHLEDVYHGACWYRRDLNVPKPPVWDKAYLHFEGVDEEAWVWLNGEYVGEHAEGPEGWSEPFLLDVTDILKLGQMNHITVRAENTAANGGIYAPVWLRVIDSTRLNRKGE